MTTYNSYEEAKIANPESEIVTTGDGWDFSKEMIGKFQALRLKNDPQALSYYCWVKCNPANHCMTVEQFLKAGHKFVAGDVVLNINNVLTLIGDKVWCFNRKDTKDGKRYILRAAALEKPKRVKVEYVKVEESIFDLQSDFESGCLFGDLVGKTKIDSLAHLGACCDTDTVYRRIETPVEWWDDLVEFINQSTGDSCAASASGETLHVRASMNRDKWCDFARILLEQNED